MFQQYGCANIMDTVKPDFTPEQQKVFDNVCGLLSKTKRRELKELYRADNDDVKITELYIKHDDAEIKVFEAFHIIGFYTKTKEDPDAHKGIIRAFKGRTAPPTRESSISQIASAETCSNKYVEAIFRILAQARNASLPECFLDFLKFCNEGGRPIRGFKNPEYLQDFISDLEKQLYPCIKTENTQNLQIKDGCLSPTSSSHTFEPSIPNNSASKNIDNVASILTWDCHLTPVIGRDEELEELHEWAESEPDKSIKVICGEGGVGKTRLAFHFAEQLKEQGWSAGQISFSQEGTYKIGDRGILIVIDYPEDQLDHVQKLIASIRQVNTTGFKVRVILLTRNEDFLSDVVNDARHIFSSKMMLDGITSLGWKLFDLSWKSIATLDERKEANHVISKDEFDLWLGQSTSNARPLIIMSLALYLFHEPNKGSLSGLSSKFILRYITEREIRRIKNEVESYSVNYKIEYQSVCLLVAISAITGGLNDALLRCMNKNSAFNLVDYTPPKAKHIKQFSIWQRGKIQPLTPDLLAADFLAYCVQTYAENQECEWLIPTLFQSSVSDDELAISINANMGRFTRLVNDYDTLSGSQHEICIVQPLNDGNYWDDIIARCLKSLNDQPITCERISKSLNSSRSRTANAFLNTASLVVLKQSNNPRKILLALIDISFSEITARNYLKVIELYNEARRIFKSHKSLEEEDIRNVISCGLNAMKSYSQLSMNESGVALGKEIYLMINPRADQQVRLSMPMCLMLAEFHYSLAICYSGIDSNRCLLLLNEADDMLDKLISESSNTRKLRSQKAHVYHAISCELRKYYSGEEHQKAALQYMNTAVNLMGQLTIDEPHEYGTTFQQFKDLLDNLSLTSRS